MKVVILILLFLITYSAVLSQTGVYRCDQVGFEGWNYDSTHITMSDLFIVGSHFELNYPLLESSFPGKPHSEHGTVKWNSTNDTLYFTLEYMDTWYPAYYANYCYMTPIVGGLLQSGHNAFMFVRDTTLSVPILPIRIVPITRE